LKHSASVSVKKYKFPKGFLWGAATSSHQVEGDNRWNDWWEYEQAGLLPYRSGDACRHYQLYDQDIALARSWGHNAHRFSIEWSRIEPKEGIWNLGAIEHYRDVLRALKRRELEPVVTLHHFTNPAWFLRRGGWLRSDSPKLFTRYVEQTVKHIGRDVKFWVTINEPTVYVKRGYITGEWPPCLKSSWFKSAMVLRNLARAHVAAYRVLHRFLDDVNVGFAHSAPLIVPCDPRRKLDRTVAWLRDAILNRSFFYLLGAFPRRGGSVPKNLDFIGINYYTRDIVCSTGWGKRALLGKSCHDDHHSDRGPKSSIGSEVYPSGLRAMLQKFSAFGIPLFITENGIATDDEDLRREFIIRHLEILAETIVSGVNVIGYLYWTLIDNFEWSLGTTARFGLAEVDFHNQKRLPRPCVKLFSSVCRNNRLTSRPR